MTAFALALGLGAAVGVDLALTLLVLGALAASPAWTDLPGALDGLATPWLIGPLALLYLLEIAAEGRSLSSLAVWHGAQAFGRPIAGLLIADLVMEGAAFEPYLVGVALGAAAASVAHACGAGWQALLHLRGVPGRGRAVAAAAEDVGVLAFLVLAIEHPFAGLFVLALPLLVGPRQVRAGAVAFRFLMASLTVAAREHLPGGSGASRQRPRWARRRLHDVPRGEGEHEWPALLVGGKAAPPSIRPGWLAVRGSAAFFAARRRSGTVGCRPVGEARPDGLFLRLAAPPPDGTPADLVVPGAAGGQGVRTLEIRV